MAPRPQEVTFEYDAMGRRVARSERAIKRGLVHAGQHGHRRLRRGAAAAAPSFRYVYGSYVDEPLLRHARQGTRSRPAAPTALY